MDKRTNRTMGKRERYMEWQQQQQWGDFEENRRNRVGVEDKTDRSERRIRNSKEEINKENLIAKERIRVERNRRYEEKEKRKQRRKTQNRQEMTKSREKNGTGKNKMR